MTSMADGLRFKQYEGSVQKFGVTLTIVCAVKNNFNTLYNSGLYCIDIGNADSVPAFGSCPLLVIIAPTITPIRKLQNYMCTNNEKMFSLLRYSLLRLGCNYILQYRDVLAGFAFR